MKLLEWFGLQGGVAAGKKGKVTHKVSVAPGGQSFEVEKGRKVILNSALSAGLGFPHNCRVGSCTQCKCKLKSGKVRELTDSSYVLSAEDLKAGMILACQSIPETDLEIEVELTSGGDRLVETRGTIVGQKDLTHDIVELRVALDQSTPDLSAARLGILKGGNHPDDIDSIIWLYLNFRHVSYLERAIDRWSVGDDYLQQLDALGDRRLRKAQDLSGTLEARLFHHRRQGGKQFIVEHQFL